MKKITKKKKRKIRLKKKVVIILLIISLIFITINLLINKNQIQNKPEPITKKEPVQEKLKQTSLSLVMVGDALIHDKIYNEAKKLGNGTYDFKPMLESIKPLIQKYDLAYYNQETILGGSDIGVSSYPAFNSPYEVGDAFIDAGFNLVSLATNHTLDRKEQAIINSRNYWNSKENILAVGSYTSIDERNQPQIREKNDITYTMLNYTYGTNGIKVPSGKEYLVNLWPVTGNNPEADTTYQNYKEQVKKDIEAVKEQVDVLIVAMHWGIEYQTTPNNYQQDMAIYLESLGVDIIIGTHPHVIQPITWINDTIVIYSLGNFISAHEVINLSNRIGLMTSIKITKEEKNNQTTITLNNLENELLYTNYTKNYQNISVIPFSQLTEEILPNYKQTYDKYKEIVQAIDSNISVNPIN